MSISIQNYEIFFQMASDLFAIVSPEGRFLLVNEMWIKTLGWSLEKMKAKPFMDFVHPDDCARTTKQFEQCWLDDAQGFVNRYIDVQGNYKYLEWSTKLVKNENFFIAVARDISDKYISKKNTEYLKLHITSLLNASNLAIFTIEADGTIFLVNRSSCNIFGYEESELIGKNISILTGPEHRRHHDLYLQKYLKTGEKKVIGKTRQLMAQKKDGTEFPIELNVGEFQQDDKKFFVGLIQDVSDKKEYERLALINSRLVTLGEMASTIVHEIKNPISVLKMNVDFMNRENKELSETDYSKNIEKSIQRIDKILKGLQAYSNSSQTTESEFDLHEVLTETESFLRPLLLKDAVEIEFLLLADECKLMGFASKIQQVVVNLIMNAKDARSLDEKPQIIVRTWNDENVLKLIISDNGIGMDAPLQKKIFEPFFTTKEKMVGTGLGLSIVKTLLNDHKADIEVKSKKGEGTQFTITFPRN